MADLSVVTAGKVYVLDSLQMRNGVASTTIAAGQAVKIEPTTGKFSLASGQSSGSARAIGIATQSVISGQALNVLEKGVMSGFDASSFSFDDSIYLSDTPGTLTSGSGTVSKIVGRIVNLFGVGSTAGSTADRALLVEL